LGSRSVAELLSAFDKYVRLLDDQTVALESLAQRLDAVLDPHLQKELSSGRAGLHATSALPLDPAMHAIEKNMSLDTRLGKVKREVRQKAAFCKVMRDWAVTKQDQPGRATPAFIFESIQEMLEVQDSGRIAYKREVGARILKDLKKLLDED